MMHWNRHLSLCTLALVGVVGGASLLHAQETNQGKDEFSGKGMKVRIGTYDSRAIAIAYAPSRFNPVKEKMAAYEKAKAAGDQVKTKELEAWGEQHQRLLHFQGFGRVPVDDLLAPLQEEIAKLARAHRLAAITPSCNFTSADVELLDVTDDLVKLYDPSEKTLNHVREIRKLKPVPLAQLTDVPAKVPQGQESQKDKGKDLPKPERLEPYKCGNVERLHVLGGIFLASQPTPEDFKLAKESGIKTVINLREKEELEWEEEALVKSLGMEYYHVPFKSPAGLTDEVFAKTRRMLANKEKHPLLLHCSSANRVGAIWLAHRVLDHGLGYEQALEEARIVGLKLPAFVDKAKDYVDRNKQQ